MKNTENRLKVEKLFVFGAGASYCATKANGEERRAPLDTDFCKRLEAVDAVRPNWVRESREILKRAWTDHLPFSTYGLEQAIIRHLGHTEFRRAIHKRRNTGVLSDLEYINHMSHLVCYILRKARESRRAPYGTFAERFFSSKNTSSVRLRIEQIQLVKEFWV